MWVLTKGGPFGDDGNLVRLFLGGEPIPEPGPGTGYLLPIPYHVAIVPFHWQGSRRPVPYHVAVALFRCPEPVSYPSVSSVLSISITWIGILGLPGTQC